MTHLNTLNRRSFLKASALAGGGAVFGFHIPFAGEALAASGDAEVNAWIVIQADDTVIIRVAHSEMGQGAFTALPMLVAEELECDWSKVKPEFASPGESLRRNKVYGDMGTVGSRAVRTSHEYLRKAGASAREMLIAAAAQKWKVDAKDCTAANSVVTHTASGRTLKYSALAEAASKLPPPKDEALKDPATWKIAGHETQRLDVVDKVLAKPIYAIDVRLPDMAYAAIAHCPVFGGKLKSYDDAAIKTMKGVVAVVPLDTAVAVVAENYWAASKALKALPVDWDTGDNDKINQTDVLKFVGSGFTATDAAVVRKDGDADAAFAKSQKVIEAEYHVPFLAHSAMEPMNAVARFTKDGLELWAPTQNAMGSLTTAAEASGLDPSKITYYSTFSGGGFGRRGGNHNSVTEVVQVAKAVGRPVKLIWSREEDMQHDFYRPISSAKFRATLDAKGNPEAWSTRIAGQSILNTANPAALAKGPDTGFLVCFTDNPYDVPNLLVDFGMRNTHVPAGYWRSVNHSQNGFFREAFVDELATAAGVDPFEYRRRLLGKAPKQLAVLEAAAKAADWGKPLPQGVFRGIAQVDGYGSYVAAVVEASVKPDGMPRTHRVVVAIDTGYVVNPDGVRQQLEGAVVWALSAAYYGEITVQNGRIAQSNFHDYRLLQLPDMPKVEVVLAPSGRFWGGVGEPGAPPVAPALVNAMFAATGKRYRSLPLMREVGPKSV